MSMCGHWDPHILLVGMQNGTFALENSLIVAQKSGVILQSSNPSPRLTSKRTKNMYIQKLENRYLSLDHPSL